jgi:hypothetical protein
VRRGERGGGTGRLRRTRKSQPEGGKRSAGQAGQHHTTTGRQIPSPLARAPCKSAVQFGSHQMCSVVVSVLNGFQFVTHIVTAVLVYPTGVAEMAEFELPKLGPPILLN